MEQREPIAEPMLTYANLARYFAENRDNHFEDKIVGENYKASRPSASSAFIELIRLGTEGERLPQQGWKFHISINKDQLSEGWDIILDVLAKNQVKRFKIVDPNSPDKLGVDEGREITIYSFKEPQRKYVQDTDQYKSWQNILIEITQRLVDAGIRPGPLAKGSSGGGTEEQEIENMNYFSYRNDVLNTNSRVKIYEDERFKGRPSDMKFPSIAQFPRPEKSDMKKNDSGSWASFSKKELSSTSKIALSLNRITQENDKEKNIFDNIGEKENPEKDNTLSQSSRVLKKESSDRENNITRSDISATDAPPMQQVNNNLNDNSSSQTQQNSTITPQIINPQNNSVWSRAQRTQMTQNQGSTGNEDKPRFGSSRKGSS